MWRWCIAGGLLAAAQAVCAFEMAERANCFFIRDLDFQLERGLLGRDTTLEWTAQVSNKCGQDLRVPIAAGFFTASGEHVLTDISIAELPAGADRRVAGRVDENQLAEQDNVLASDVLLESVRAMEANLTDRFLQEAREALAVESSLVNVIEDAVGDRLKGRVRIDVAPSLE